MFNENLERMGNQEELRAWQVKMGEDDSQFLASADGGKHRAAAAAASSYYYLDCISFRKR